MLPFPFFVTNKGYGIHTDSARYLDVFCDNLIVAPLTAESDERDVYLPVGEWRDYFTKEPVNSGWFKVNTKNIPVYEKVQR